MFFSFTPVLFLLSLLAIVSAYSFEFTNTPQQCQNLSISITGAGQPPYFVLIVPFGPSPLPNNIEARRIFTEPFSGNSGSVSFQLKYPANSQFVAVVSDSYTFGSGGTSVAAIVQPSSDSSCFDATTNVSPSFFFSLEPPNQIVQCVPTRIWWDPATVQTTGQGTPSFVGVIPGGQSFSIPQSPLTTVPQQGLGFSWTPSVRGGTTLMIVGGDDRGLGSAGSTLVTVGSGITTNNTCLDTNSPSSTPANPAGGRYPTSTSWSSSSSSSSKSNTAAIVGGVVGGLTLLLALLLAIFFFWRRNRQSNAKNSVNLLQGDEGDGPSQMREQQQLPAPEPFLIPEPTVASRSSFQGHTLEAGGAHGGYDSLSDDRSNSRLSTTDMPGTSIAASSRKSGAFPRLMRPINIIQHDDAGPSEPSAREEDEEPETVELPPAYSNIKK